MAPSTSSFESMETIVHSRTFNPAKPVVQSDVTRIGPLLGNDLTESSHQKNHILQDSDAIKTHSTNGHYRIVSLQVVLDINFARVRDVEAFRREVCADLAAAAELCDNQVSIEDIYARNRFTVVHARLAAGCGHDARQAAWSLAADLADAGSALLRGRHTRHATKIALVPDRPSQELGERAERGLQAERVVQAARSRADARPDHVAAAHETPPETYGHAGKHGENRGQSSGPDERDYDRPRRSTSTASSSSGEEAREMERAFGALARAMSAQNDDLRRLSAVQDAVASVYGAASLLPPPAPPQPPPRRISADVSSDAVHDSWDGTPDVGSGPLAKERIQNSRPTAAASGAISASWMDVDEMQSGEKVRPATDGPGYDLGQRTKGQRGYPAKVNIISDACQELVGAEVARASDIESDRDNIYGRGPCRTGQAPQLCTDPPKSRRGGHRHGPSQRNGSEFYIKPAELRASWEEEDAPDLRFDIQEPASSARLGHLSARTSVGLLGTNGHRVAAIEGRSGAQPLQHSVLPAGAGSERSLLTDSGRMARVRDKERPETLADLAPEEQAALLAATPVRERGALLLALPPQDAADVLCAMPPSEGCLTLRQLPTACIRRIVDSMAPAAREVMVLRMTPRELEGLIDGLGPAALADLLTGLTARAVAHVFRGVRVQLQAAMLAVLGDRDRCMMLTDLMPRDRSGLMSVLPSRLCAAVLRLLKPTHVASVYQGMQRVRFLEALEEMMPEDQMAILDSLPRKDRHEALAQMSKSMAATILGVMPLPDRMSAFQTMEPADGASILAEMSYGDAVQLLSLLSSSERAALLSKMSERGRAIIAMTMNPETLAPSLVLMDSTDRRFFLGALQEQERAAIFAAMSPQERALVWKDLVSGVSGEQCATELAGTLRHMNPDDIAFALSEMACEERIQYLLLMGAKARALVLQAMEPRDSAEVLDLFLLEDRAITVRLMDVQSVSKVLQEMPPHKKALLLASVGHKERGAILTTMSSHDLSLLLSVLPLADCVSTLKLLGPKLAASALLEMSADESSLTLEAVQTRDRAYILLAMQHEDAAHVLERLQPEICAATLKYFGSDSLVKICSELPVSVRAKMFSFVPIKTRAKALAEMGNVDRANLFEAMHSGDLTNTLKEMSLRDIESCFSSVSVVGKMRILPNLPFRECSKLVISLPLEEQGELFCQMPLEFCEALLKNFNPATVSEIFNHLPTLKRDQLLSSLPDKVRKEILALNFSGSSSQSTFQDSASISNDDGTSSSTKLTQLKTVKTLGQPETQINQQKVATNKGISTYCARVKQSSSASSEHQSVTSCANGRISQSPNATARLSKSAAVQTEKEMNEESIVITLRSRMNTATFCNTSLKLMWTEQMCGDIAAAISSSATRFEIDNVRLQSSGSLDTPSYAGYHIEDVLFDLKILPRPKMNITDSGIDSKSAREIANEIVLQGSDPTSRLNRLHHSLLSIHLDSQQLQPNTKPLTWLSEQQHCLRHGKCSHGHLEVADFCGVDIAFVPTADGKHLSVMQIAPDCSASPEKSVHVGDIICSVDGRDITESPLPIIARSVLGPPGSFVEIGFQSPGTNTIKNVKLLRSSSSPARHLKVHVAASELSPENENVKSQGSESTESKSKNVNLDFDTKNLNLQHSIWSTIEDLDHAIETRVQDMKSFTQSIVQLQMEAVESSKRINAEELSYDTTGTGTL